LFSLPFVDVAFAIEPIMAAVALVVKRTASPILLIKQNSFYSLKNA
jgi:hypothetical protein